MSMKLMRDSRGVSILELLIGVGILVLIIPFAMKNFLNTQRSGAQNENRFKMRSIARTLEGQVDCPNVPKVCTNGQLVAIPKRNGGVLIASDGSTRQGGWALRALCTGSNQFQVQAARVDAAGKFIKDPVTQKPLDWDHPGSTLFPEKALCASQPKPTVTSTDPLIEIKVGASCVVNQASALPCPAQQPPPCGPGYSSRGVSLDTFGGDDDPAVIPVFGQRWMRYCGKDEP